MDDERRRRERDVARGAVGGAVVVDLSTLVVAAYVRRVWPDLRGQFSSVEIPGPARRDVIETVEEFERPVNGFLFFDRTSSAVRGSDADAEVQERLAEHAQWVRAESSGMPTTEAIDLGVLNPALDDSFLPWLSALALAKQKNVPLWCDDLGLRTLAADDGVRTFGTVALLEAMTETASIEGAVLVGALRLLREEYAVDLELDEEWIRLSAASVEWKAGPAAFYFARGESWASFETTLPLWAEMAQAAADSEPARVAGWVHAAALGVSSALDPARARAVISHLAARGVAFAGIDATALAACAARAREVGLAAGVGNPVPGMIRTLFDTLSAAVGPDVAARMLLSNELADEDRAVVVDMLFGASAPTAG